MIQEIFIITNDPQKIMIGDPALYPKDNEYPTIKLSDSQMTSLSINNVTISVLYRSLDVFTILEYIQRLRRRLESELKVINSKSIHENYFNVLDMVKRSEVTIFNPKKHTFLNITTNEIFVDVLETYNVVISNGVVKNEIVGYCYVKPSFNEVKTLKLVIDKAENSSTIYNEKTTSDKNINKKESYNENRLTNSNSISNNIISKYNYYDKFNKIEIETEVKCTKLEMFKYRYSLGRIPLINIIRKDSSYVLEVDNIFFDLLEILIPVPEKLKSIKITNSQGGAKYLENKSIVQWCFRKERMRQSRINIEVDVFEEEKDFRSITCNFRIPNKSLLKIEKAVCLGNQNVNVWIRYDSCSGVYQIN